MMSRACDYVMLDCVDYFRGVTYQGVDHAFIGHYRKD